MNVYSGRLTESIGRGKWLVRHQLDATDVAIVVYDHLGKQVPHRAKHLGTRVAVVECGYVSADTGQWVRINAAGYRVAAASRLAIGAS